MHRSRVTKGLGAVAVTALLGGLAVTVAGPASAVTINVTNTNNTGPGSLRQAILDTDTNVGPDTIVVQAGLGTITVDSSLVWNDDSVTIEGNDVTVDFGGSSRGFVDNSGEGVEIDSMTIMGVTGSSGDDNAPVVSEGGDVVVAKCTISGNDVTSSEGDVAGGVLSEGGAVTVNACTITGNAAHGSADGAGGVLSEGGAVNVSNSTISGNTVDAPGDTGGGVGSEGGNLIITGSHISCNTGTSDGGDAAGGILNEGGGSFTIRTSDILGNRATTTGDGVAVNSIRSVPAGAVISGSTVSDDASSCAVPATTTTTAPATTTTAAAAAAQAVATQPAFTG